MKRSHKYSNHQYITGDSLYLRLLFLVICFCILLIVYNFQMQHIYNNEKQNEIKQNNVSKDNMMLSGEYIKYDVVKDLKFDNTGKADVSEKLKEVINKNKNEDLLLYFPEGDYKLEPSEFKLVDIKKLYFKGENNKVNFNMNNTVLEINCDKNKKDTGIKLKNLNFNVKNNKFIELKYYNNIVIDKININNKN